MATRYDNSVPATGSTYRAQTVPAAPGNSVVAQTDSRAPASNPASNGVNAYNTAQANQAAARNANTVSTASATPQTSFATQAANNMANNSAVFRVEQPISYAGQANNGFSRQGLMSYPGNGSGYMPIAAAQEQSVDPNSVAAVAPGQSVVDYLNNYNTDREQKIRDMYAGNLASQNAGLKTALDTNLGTMKTAYDTNLGNLRTAYDNNVGSLKTAYDANLGTLRTAYDTNVANLANAYAQQRSDAEAARDKISPQYQESMNALSSEYERLRRNTNMQGAVNGLNTGAGTQLALGQNMAYQRNQGNLARSENEALNEAERGLANLSRDYYNRQNILDTEYTNNRANMDTKYANETDRLNREYQNNLATYGTTYQNNIANLKTNYENQIAQAAANNDYQMAAALLDEYGSQFDRMQNQAALLAQFGDFSAYAELYGQDAADNMKLNWALSNPDVAWASGNLKAEDYFALTGKYPNDPNMMMNSRVMPEAAGYNTFQSKYGGNHPGLNSGTNTSTTGYYNGVSNQNNPLTARFQTYGTR